MAGLTNVLSLWGVITEIDIRPLVKEAMLGARLAIVGAPAIDRSALADQLRRDPAHPAMESDTPVLILDLEQARQPFPADLIILVLDGMQADFSREKELARAWNDSGQRVAVLVDLPISYPPEKSNPPVPAPALPWKTSHMAYGPIANTKFLHEKFASVVIRLLPDKLLGLGRDYPFFRIPIARYIVNDTAMSNAAYSLGTGLAEIVPILNIPFVITDFIILTKTQVFMAYKLGLAFGFDLHPQSYVAEFGSVIGVGFLFRQLARSLVGLIPGFGIVPKVAISYAGTVAVGKAVLQWYQTGRQVTGSQLNSFYHQALDQGKKVAARLITRRSAPGLPPPQRKSAARVRGKPRCLQCGRTNARNASYCQYCGDSLLSTASAIIIDQPPTG